MTTSRRVADRKVARFEGKLTKKGSGKKGFNFSTGLALIGFCVFVVVGSCLFMIIRTATNRGNVV
ncbi:unnamed protein product [Trifolium pratense]|uniref:Uncharacterized protein n=1 Tax=Trifolium pratense TaxID=57577 RepID=A0ACB0KSD2_TRIPR|nr:unnamed protein product [Trifolium pratense]